MEESSGKVVAHIRLSGSAEVEVSTTDHEQELKDHLLAVSTYAGNFAQKIGLEHCGKLVGLLHDIGKASKAFQEYIRVSAYSQKIIHKVDHATAGARLLHEYYYKNLVQQEKSLDQTNRDHKTLKKRSRLRRRLLEILENVIIGHHSGLYAYFSLDESAVLERRLLKDEKEMFFDEAEEYLFSQVLSKKDLDDLIERAYGEFEEIFKKAGKLSGMTAGLLTKFLYSCLIDADRLDSFLFEEDKSAEPLFKEREHSRELWEKAYRELMQSLQNLKEKRGKLNGYRREISDIAENRANKIKTGILTLSIPTGAGKTLTAIRFALKHAMKTGKKRIIYITNYLTVIEQNAEVIRKTMPSVKDDILEFHSNVLNGSENGEAKNKESQERENKDLKNENESYSWASKQNGLLQERWESPLIFTSLVQFMNTFFEGKSSNRKLHQLADSIVIFDEVQSMPTKTVYLFCQAVNFLKLMNSTVILCTATQPQLEEIEEFGIDVSDSPDHELIPNVSSYFEAFRRTQIYRHKKIFNEIQGIADFLGQRLQDHNSLLMITNTVRSARDIFLKMKDHEEYDSYYLSTALCPAHRKSVIKEIREKLDALREGKSGKKIVCISTPIIEAGVDISFEMVVRSVTGLDSIAQAAGRCNREKEREFGEVHIVELSTDIENLSRLDEIELKQSITKEILRGKSSDLNAILFPETLEKYFGRLNNKQKKDYRFPIDLKNSGGGIAFQDSSIFDILNSNTAVKNELLYQSERKPRVNWVNSCDIRTAEKEFYVIPQKGKQVLVPYTNDMIDGKEIINTLYSQSASLGEKYHALRKAQQITISLFDNVFLKLVDQKMITGISQMEGVYVLNETYYSQDSGFVGLESSGEITYLDI